MEIEYVIIDNNRFGIINEVKYENTTYVYLANLEDPTDQLIRKYTTENQDDLFPLDSDAEFDFALTLFND